LIITELQPDDALRLFTPFCDRELYTYIPGKVPASAEELRARFERICIGHSPDGNEVWRNWVASAKTTGECCGYFQATIIGTDAMLAYFTFMPYQRQGLAKEGINAIIKYLSENFPIQKFVLEMDTRNLPSTRLAESLGFGWIKTTDNVCELNGVWSHEFRFEKNAVGTAKVLMPSQIQDYVSFRYPTLPEVEKSARIERIQMNFQSYVGTAEKVFLSGSSSSILGSMCLLNFAPRKFGIANLIIRDRDRYSEIFSCLIEAATDECKTVNASSLEYRLVEGDMTKCEEINLSQRGFRRIYHRTEFRVDLSQLPTDNGTPLQWEALPDLSDLSLRPFVKLMELALAGYDDWEDDADATTFIRSCLDENDLTSHPQCFQMARFEGQDIGFVIAQVDTSTGWSRITYMGLVPEFRGRGLGKWIHRHGFRMMHEQGGSLYHGGTLTGNHPMIRLFQSHGCHVYRTMQGWRLGF
jgi:RimJ/RimL family protein N-acetyltransferase